jgi:colanic acid/amylovoran biosynthesis protein
MPEISIGIVNAHNTLNYGSMMMCENTIFYLSKILPNVSFIVLSDFVEETENRLKRATGCKNISVRPRTISSPMVKGISNKMSFIVDQVMLRYKNLNRILDNCKVIIVLGGDDIAEYYGIIRLVDILLRLRYLKRADKKVYLLGQTIGPVHSWRLALAGGVLSKMDRIYHRGPLSYNYVTNVLGIKGNSFLSADLAFLDLARQDSDCDIRKYNIEPRRYITFVPSGFWSSYCHDYKTYLDGLLNVTNYLLERCRRLDFKLVLLPHVLRTSDDRALVNQIATCVRNGNVIGITDVLLPYEARTILGSSYFVVTQRMHGAISSLQRRVPALSLSYSIKFSEVVGSYLDLPELVVEVRKDNFKEDIIRACSAIDSSLEGVNALKDKIRKAVNKAKRDAMSQIEDLSCDMLA